MIGNNLLSQVLHSAGTTNFEPGVRLLQQDYQQDPLEDLLLEEQEQSLLLHDWSNALLEDDETHPIIAGNGGSHPYNVVGLLLAAASVIFIIIGIAFVFTRVRRRKPSPDQPDTGDLEMVETTKPDPYAEWLNMPEEEPPKPALKKQVKTVVRTVSRKMSLTPKPHEEVFTPGVPEHLRYQLKQIYVY